MEIDEFLCDFCNNLKPCDELAQKTLDKRLKCDECMHKAIERFSDQSEINKYD